MRLLAAAAYMMAASCMRGVQKGGALRPLFTDFLQLCRFSLIYECGILYCMQHGQESRQVLLIPENLSQAYTKGDYRKAALQDETSRGQKGDT